MRARPGFLAVALLGAGSLLSGCVFVISPFGSVDNELRETTVSGEGDAKILWLPIEGFISDAPVEQAFGLVQRPSTLARVAAALDKAEADDDIAAVILRIDSPGGTVAASDEIYARIQRYQETTEVPVVASFGGIAASGGYYVAMAAEHIGAQPTTITGSIGVIILGFDASGLLDKLGIENETYTSGPNKDLLSPLKGASAEERRIIQGILDSLFERFVQVVRTNRPALDSDRLARITDGRVFVAGQALDLGLIDEIGRVDDAIDAAKQRAGVDEARVILYYHGRQPPQTVYASAATHTTQPAAAQVNILPIDLSLDGLTQAQWLYLWRPGE